MHEDSANQIDNCRPVIVMGVSGSGKTSVSQALAVQVKGVVLDGDAFHSRANIEKMRTGTPLNDEDRVAWLDRLAAAVLAEHLVQRPVLACSALRRAYRERLRSRLPHLRFVFLDVPYRTALERVTYRTGHFMPPQLVRSQFEDLERPDGEHGVTVVDATRPIDQIIGVILPWYHDNHLG